MNSGAVCFDVVVGGGVSREYSRSLSGSRENSSPLDVLELVLSCFTVLEWVQAHLRVLEMVLDLLCGSIDGPRSQSSKFESSRSNSSSLVGSRSVSRSEYGSGVGMGSDLGGGPRI